MVSMMSERFLKKAFRSRIAKALGIIIVLGVIFAPSGFFTGQRTVTLEAEISIIEPTVHLQGDEISTNATLTGRVVTSTGMPISGAIITAFNDRKTRQTWGLLFRADFRLGGLRRIAQIIRNPAAA